VAVALVATGAVAASAKQAINLSGVTIRLGQIEPMEQAEVAASGVLAGAPYTVSWSTFQGPSPMMAALLSGAIDAGANFGDVSVTLANAASAVGGKPWSVVDAPVKTIGVEGSVYPFYETIASTSSGITKLSQIKGHTFVYDVGGNIQAQYLLDLAKAHLKPSDVKPVIVQAAALGSTFQAGDGDVVSEAASQVAPFLADGSARVISTEKDIGLPGLDAFVASTHAIADPARRAALADLLTRLTRFYAWYAKHLPAIASILQSVADVPAQYALQEAKLGENYFEPATPAVYAEEQSLAGTLTTGGVITTKVNVKAQYDSTFNSVISAANKKYGIPKG
jgi:sulfonate transport system substrate-binding protein